MNNKRKCRAALLGWSFLTACLLHAGDETWNTPTYDAQFNSNETDGTLTVQSGGDVHAGGTLVLRARDKIIIQPGFRAHSGSEARLGIDGDLDGYTESDADGDGIPDQYEEVTSGLDPFDPTDALSIHGPTGMIFYDVYHLNLNHGASQGSNRFPAPAAGDLLEELELPDPTLDQREVTFRFGEYGYEDTIKDYWAEVVEWSTAQPFFPFSFQTNFFGFNPFSYQVFDPGGPVSVVLTPLEPTLYSTSWILSDLPVFYDVVRHGKPSGPWEGGSFPASFGIAPNLDNDDFIIIDPEVVEWSDGTITLKLELPESESGITYVPVLKTSTGLHKKPLQGPLKIDGGGAISITIVIDESDLDLRIGFLALSNPIRVRLEPINNEVVPGFTHRVYNPAGISLNETEFFKIEVSPEPETNVTWTKKPGSGPGNVQVVNLQDKGRVAEIKGTQVGELVLQANIPDFSDPKPEIKVKVVQKETIKLWVGLVNDSIFQFEFDILIDPLNELYRQIGVEFVVEQYFTDIQDMKYDEVNKGDPELYMLPGEITSQERNNEDGLEVYILPKTNLDGITVSTDQIDFPNDLLFEDRKAILIDKEDLTVELLAHEIGHSFGAEHVFSGPSTEVPDAFISPETDVSIKGTFIPYDFSMENLNDDGYYYSGRKYNNLLNMMIMNGFRDLNRLERYRDLTFGPAYGFNDDEDIPGENFILGDYEVGFFNSPEKPRRPNHVE